MEILRGIQFTTYQVRTVFLFLVKRFPIAIGIENPENSGALKND